MFLFFETLFFHNKVYCLSYSQIRGCSPYKDFYSPFSNSSFSSFLVFVCRKCMKPQLCMICSANYDYYELQRLTKIDLNIDFIFVERNKNSHTERFADRF